MKIRISRLLFFSVTVSLATVFSDEIKSIDSPSERGTIEDKSERIRGDSGKWRDDARLQVAPSPDPDAPSFDDWADGLPDDPGSFEAGKEVWLIYRTEQLDDNDRVWVESVKRDLENGKITVVFARATWQGNYRKNFTWYSATGVNLGPLPAGNYEVEWIEKLFEFRQFDDPAKRQDAWPADLSEPGESTSIGVSFRIGGD